MNFLLKNLGSGFSFLDSCLAISEDIGDFAIFHYMFLHRFQNITCPARQPKHYFPCSATKTLLALLGNQNITCPARQPKHYLPCSATKTLLTLPGNQNITCPARQPKHYLPCSATKTLLALLGNQNITSPA